jgi:hypothetical protein
LSWPPEQNFSLAADAGFEPSKELLATVSEKMTPEQIAEAKEKLKPGRSLRKTNTMKVRRCD